MDRHGLTSKAASEATDLATRAATAFGLGDVSSVPIQDLVNQTFRLTCGNDSYLLRLHRPTRHSRQAVESELQWIEALRAETPLCLQKPLRAVDGNLTATVPGPDGTIIASVLSWLPGEILSQGRRTSAHFRAIGHVLAHIHRHGVGWRPPIPFDRPLLDAAGLAGTLAAVQYREWLPPSVCDDLDHVVDLAQKAEVELGRNPSVFGPVHGDPSFGNVLFDSSDIALIDFDDCGCGHHLYDLAVVLAGAWARSDSVACRSELLAGYRELAPHVDDGTHLLPAFMARRAAGLIAESLSKADGAVEEDAWRGQWERIRVYVQSSRDPLII